MFCYMTGKKIKDICILCRWINNFLNILYYNILKNKNRDDIISYDMSIIIPIVRNSFMKWYYNHMNKLVPNKKNIFEMKNKGIMAEFIRKLILFRENNNNKDTENFVKKHSGLVALEFIKSKFFKNIIEII
jgi:hypothetical protein